MCLSVNDDMGLYSTATDSLINPRTILGDSGRGWVAEATGRHAGCDVTVAVVTRCGCVLRHQGIATMFRRAISQKAVVMARFRRGPSSGHDYSGRDNHIQCTVRKLRLPVLCLSLLGMISEPVGLLHSPMSSLLHDII